VIRAEDMFVGRGLNPVGEGQFQRVEGGYDACGQACQDNKKDDRQTEHSQLVPQESFDQHLDPSFQY
jgi:hypothetical protein